MVTWRLVVCVCVCLYVCEMYMYSHSHGGQGQVCQIMWSKLSVWASQDIQHRQRHEENTSEIFWRFMTSTNTHTQWCLGTPRENYWNRNKQANKQKLFKIKAKNKRTEEKEEKEKHPQFKTEELKLASHKKNTNHILRKWNEWNLIVASRNNWNKPSTHTITHMEMFFLKWGKWKLSQYNKYPENSSPELLLSTMCLHFHEYKVKISSVKSGNSEVEILVSEILKSM